MQVTDQQWTTLIINNVIPSGAAFGFDQTTGASCFIPASVMFNTGAQIGEQVDVLLIDNPNLVARSRTPYMVQYLQPASRHAVPTVSLRHAPSNQTVGLAEFVRDRMRNGGVWTVGALLDEYREDPRSTRIGIDQEIRTVAATLHLMFTNSECAKWVMYKNGTQTTAAEEWYGCYPDRVDVDEWE
jgi:hypothetical protein